MIEKFPYLNKSVSVINKYNSIILKDIEKRKHISLNREAYNLLLECSGVKTLKQVILGTLKGHGEGGDTNDYIEKTISFITDLSEAGYILYADASSKRIINITDVPDICYPNNIVFELTDFCNLRCKHCYRGSDSSNTDYIDAELLVAVVAELSRFGLRSVHLTGGEPGAHKDFLYILTNVLEHCESIIILTNGTCFDEEALKVFAANKDRLKIQVDIDCSEEAIHDDLRGVSGAFKAVSKFIKEAAAHKIPIEAAMSVYKNNVDYIEQTLIYSKELGASSFKISPVMEYGRGQNMERLDEEQTYKLLTSLPELHKKYKGFIIEPEVSMDEMEERFNCGGGHRNFICSPNGEIKPCVLLPDDMIVMGNLFTEKTDKLFAKPIFKHFANLQAPNKKICGECQYATSCLGCFARVLLLEETMRAANPDFECIYKKNILFK